MTLDYTFGVSSCFILRLIELDILDEYLNYWIIIDSRYAHEEHPAEWKERGTGEVKRLKLIPSPVQILSDIFHVIFMV